MERRFFLLGGGASFLNLAFTSYPGKSLESNPNFKAFIQDLNPNPIFRAATARMYNNLWFGHAGILKIDNSYQLRTVEHVARRIQSTNAHQARALVPGIAVCGLDTQRIRYHPRTGQYEALSSYQITGELLDRVLTAEEEGTLKPSEPSSTHPETGSQIALPNSITGKYEYYDVLGYRFKSSSVIVKSRDGEPICTGQSGTPLLKVVEGQVVPIAYGFVSAVRNASLVHNPHTDLTVTCGNLGIISLAS